MNNYKITLYRTVVESFFWAAEAENATEALALAKEAGQGELSWGEWEQKSVSDFDFEVEIAR